MSPIGKYFKNHGNEVMASMVKSNKGDIDAAKREFYATSNKHPDMKPAGERKSKRKSIGARIAEGMD